MNIKPEPKQIQRRLVTPFKLCLYGCLYLGNLVGCRGGPSEQPPVHWNPNMDSQPRYDPQSESEFYEDRRTMRKPVDGTLARERYVANVSFETGKEGEQYLTKLPLPITPELLNRGQEKYNIYCTPCHDKTGYGNGLVVQRGYPKPTNFHEDYAKHMTDGQLYAAIAVGARNMPGYGAQIPNIQDRWAIVAYVRALQLSQSATKDDVPAEKRASLQVEANP